MHVREWVVQLHHQVNVAFHGALWACSEHLVDSAVDWVFTAFIIYAASYLFVNKYLW